MRKQIVSVALVLVFCSTSAALIVSMAQPRSAEAVDPSIAERVEAHQQMLEAMGKYFATLQEKKLLPTPDELAQMDKKK